MKRISLATSLLLLAASLRAATFTGADVGTPAMQGSVDSLGGGEYVVSGSGNDIWGTSDNFHYYYTSATGMVWEASVQVKDLQGPDGWTKAELMVRLPGGATPQGNDPFIAAMTTRSAGQNEIRPQWRSVRGGSADGLAPSTPIRPVYPNVWLKIRREYSVFSVYHGTDGTTWTKLADLDTAGSIRGSDNQAPFASAWPDIVAVGVAVTSHLDGDIGSATIANLKYESLPPTKIPSKIDTAVALMDVTTHNGSEASFSYLATNDVPEVPLVYTWYKNNQLLPGVTGRNYTLLATSADNNAIITVKAAMNPWNDPGNLSVWSTGKVTVLPGVQYTNGVKVEYWANVSRDDVKNGNVGPGLVYRANSLDFPDDAKLNYSRRVTGWFIPTVTGDYDFAVAADDDTDVYLSTDASPANKRIVAQETGWSGYQNYATMGGGNAGQRRSSSYSPDEGITYPYGSGIPLVAGTPYYLEVVHHQGTGGGNLSVTYTMLGEPVDDGMASALNATNKNLVFITSPTTNLVWQTELKDTSVYDGLTATLEVKATSNTEMAPVYQWYRDGAMIAGATDSSYKFVASVANDNNAKFQVVAKTQAGGLSITSSVVTLTVLQSVFEPGFALAEYWPGATLAMITNNSAGVPQYAYAAPAWEHSVPSNEDGSAYGFRFSGLFVPPTSTTYDFFINSDDQGLLFLSTDNTAEKKRLIAQETSWADPLNWVGGGSTLSQKRSDQWANPNGEVPYANGISLTANSKYYMEAVMVEGSGGDNLQATFKKHSDADPVNGDRSKLTGNVIGINAVRCSYVDITKQPADISTAPLTTATFSVEAATDSLMPIGGTDKASTNNYLWCQWYKNGVAIPGANAASYTTPVLLPADNGAKFSVAVRALGYADDSLKPIWTNSTTATLHVIESIYEPGYAKLEFWQNNPTRAAIEAGTAGEPTWTTTIPAWQIADNGDAVNNYGRRVSGFFVPPATGDYVMFINADDDADLFLSTNDSPLNKRLVAQETAWGTGPLNWRNSGDATTTTQKDSSTWSPDAGVTVPYASGIRLTSGTKYYLEAVHHEGGGGDYLAATFKTLATAAELVDGEASSLRGNVIGVYAPRASYMHFTQQPQSATVTNGFGATFTVTATTDAETSVSADGRTPTLDNKVLYQWYKNGVAIQGATQPTLTIGEFSTADNNASITVAVRALGYADNSLNPIWSNSLPAKVTVITAPPVFVSATAYLDGRTEPATSYIDIAFNKRMNAAALGNLANYTFTGGLTVSAVEVSADGKVAKLTVTGSPTAATTLTVRNLTDADGQALTTSSALPVASSSLNFVDIGTPGVNPIFPSVLYVTGPDSFAVKAQGSDIWGTADAFGFLYEERTGDFDVVVRQNSITQSDAWAKGGLMAREELTPGSRHWNVLNTPQGGANITVAQQRSATDGESSDWHTASVTQNPYPNAWVRIKRTGQSLSAFHSTDGQSWTLAAQSTPDPALPATLYVGIVTTGHGNDSIDTPVESQTRWNLSVYSDFASNYVYVPPTVGASLTYGVQNNALTIQWTPVGGRLEQSADLANWTAVGTANPATITIGPESMFFRVVK